MATEGGRPGLALAAVALCWAAPVSARAQTAAAPPDLEVSELRPGVWRHTSWRTMADGTRLPSNGLLVKDGDHLLMVDTAWGTDRTAELLRWIDANLELPVREAVVTHWHDDRLGGGALLLARGVRMRTQPLTYAAAVERTLPLPDPIAALARPGGAARVGPVEVFYPGPAHTRDNVVVWLPRSRILFGGCAVRPADTDSLGNVADADVAQWPTSIERVLKRYAKAEVVVPSHGAPGGVELLRHTIEVAERARPK